MAINPVKVHLDEILFLRAAEDFQKETNDAGQEVYRTSYDGESYSLDVTILGSAEERGEPILKDQAVTIEVPIANADAELKRIRAIPRLTEVKIDSLTMRHGVTKNGKAYAMWSGTNLRPAKAAAPAPAQRQG